MSENTGNALAVHEHRHDWTDGGRAFRLGSRSGGEHGASGGLLPGHPARSMIPRTPLLSSCSAGDNGGACNQLALTAIGAARHAPTDAVFTWAKAKKLLRIR
jgi:hypothetical protein